MDTPIARNYDDDPVSPELRALYAANNIKVLWESENGALGASHERGHVWHWSDTRPIMLETAKITLPAIIERRVMTLVNPTSTNIELEAASGVLNAGLQALMPGEHARPHRHSMHALRFIIEGAGAETVVEGKPCTMEPGDLVVTPGWTWHEHRHTGGKPTIWVDILDAALQRSLGTAAFQPGPVSNPLVAIPDAAFTGATFVPVAAQAERRGYSPVFRYSWTDAKRAVEAAPPGADGARTVRYADPVDGGPVLPTIDCYLTQLEPGVPTRGYRESSSAICVVVEGEGESRIGDDIVKWRPHDIFTLPPHQWISHTADSTARIFIATSRDIYRRLGLLVEEQAA